MRVEVKGVHEVETTLSDGSKAIYRYAWRGKGAPRLYQKPGTDAFFVEHRPALKKREGKKSKNNVDWLIERYRRSQWFQKLKINTLKDYDRALDRISEEYGELHIADLDRKGFRSHVRVWHEGIGKKTARTADMTLAVFQRLVKFAVNEELIARNRISDMEKLHRVTHKEQVWPISLINHVLENAKPHIRDVFLFALVTMQRQGDCLSAPVLAYQDGRLAIKQGKGHARVWITPPELLKPIIDREHGQRTLLVNSRGEPWTQSGFQSSYKKEMKRLEIEGYRFHDLRGTGITFCYHMGIDLETIAHISGHTNSEINNTIRRHYLAGEMVANAFDGTFGKQKV